MKRTVILFLLFKSCFCFCQASLAVNSTFNLNTSRLMVMADVSKSIHDSLGTHYLQSIFIKDSTKIIAILSFVDGGKTHSFWKIKQNGKSINFHFLNTAGVITQNKSNSFEEVRTFFSLKIDVFQELLYANGKHKATEFKELHEKTRGNFGLLNLSKLMIELYMNEKIYKVLMEND